MSSYAIRTTQSSIDPKDRARRLSRVYALILSWPDLKVGVHSNDATVPRQEEVGDSGDEATSSKDAHTTEDTA